MEMKPSLAFVTALFGAVVIGAACLSFSFNVVVLVFGAAAPLVYWWQNYVVISPERDARNKAAIKRSFRVVLGFGLSIHQQWLLSNGSPKDRNEYVSNRRFLMLLIASALFSECKL